MKARREFQTNLLDLRSKLRDRISWTSCMGFDCEDVTLFVGNQRGKELKDLTGESAPIDWKHYTHDVT